MRFVPFPAPAPAAAALLLLLLLRCGKLFAGRGTTFLLTGEHVAGVLGSEIQIYGPNNRRRDTHTHTRRVLSNQMANGNARANEVLMRAKW